MRGSSSPQGSLYRFFRDLYLGYSNYTIDSGRKPPVGYGVGRTVFTLSWVLLNTIRSRGLHPKVTVEIKPGNRASLPPLPRVTWLPPSASASLPYLLWLKPFQGYTWFRVINVSANLSEKVRIFSRSIRIVLKFVKNS